MPNDQQDELQITDAGTWRSKRKEGFVTRLPSGNTCRVRRTMDLMTLLRSGQIPNPLAKIVKESIKTAGDISKMDTSDLDEEAIEQMLVLMEDTAIKAIVEPPVKRPPEDLDDPEGWQPPEGCISTYDLTIEDKFFIFQVAQGGAADLGNFRTEQAAAMARVPDGQAVPRAAQPASGGG